MKKVDDEVIAAYENAGTQEVSAAGFGTEKKLLMSIGEAF